MGVIKYTFEPGQQIGFLTVIGRSLNPKDHHARYYDCRCSCGRIVSVPAFGLGRGDNKTCGCRGRSPDEIGLSYYELRKKRGLCIKHDVPAVDGTTRCAPCLIRQHDRNRWFLSNLSPEELRERRGRYDRDYVARRKMKGLCAHKGCPNTPSFLSSSYYCKTHSRFHSEKQRSTFAQLKDRLLAHYGRQCACCGESNPSFLTIDHVNGDGAQERHALKGQRASIWREIIKAGFPNRYQILCYNCNCAKRNDPQCPHQLEWIPTDADLEMVVGVG